VDLIGTRCGPFSTLLSSRRTGRPSAASLDMLEACDPLSHVGHRGARIQESGGSVPVELGRKRAQEKQDFHWISRFLCSLFRIAHSLWNKW